MYVGHVVGRVHNRRNRLLGQCGYGTHGRKLHRLVDGRSPAVESAAEYVGKSEHVVDLVGIVAAARGEYEVGAR